MSKSYGAILFGITIGIASLIPLQALNNHQAKRACNADDSSKLVLVRAFAGDAYHCVENRYL